MGEGGFVPEDGEGEGEEAVRRGVGVHGCVAGVERGVRRAMAMGGCSRGLERPRVQRVGVVELKRATPGESCQRWAARVVWYWWKTTAEATATAGRAPAA